MFSGLKQRILLGVYIFILLSIPLGSYLVSQSTQTKTEAAREKPSSTITQPIPVATVKPLSKLTDTASPAPSVRYAPSEISGENANPSLEALEYSSSFGPTLKFKLAIDARPSDNQSSKVFVGILAGTNLSSPQYLLSFTVDVPASGEFDSVSLAGLTVGETYTAILKGDAQLAASSEFTMNPSVSILNSGQGIEMTSGDLNQDNTINEADLQIAIASLGQTDSASDLNKDGVVNSMDLAIIQRNLGKIGATGVWASTPPSSTPSGSLATDPSLTPAGAPVIPPESRGGQQAVSSSGYWVWVPK